MLIIKHGKIVTMANRLLDGGDILVENGKIVDISDALDYTPQRTDEVIDASDCFVFPGFIDAHCRVGVIDDGIDDVSLANNPLIPASGVVYSVDFDSEEFFECIKSGVTTIMVAPANKAIVSGKCAAIKTAKTRRNDNRRMGSPGEPHILSEYTGMQFSLTGMGEASTPEQAALIVSMLRDELNAAVSYKREREAAESEDKYYFTSPALENYIPLLSGELPAFVSVNTVDEMDMAVRIFKKYGIKAVLVCCNECDELSDTILKTIAEDGFSVIFGSWPSKSTYNLNPAKRGEIEQIPMAISTSHPVTNIQYLPICAGLASREGLAMDKALEAITVNPAAICGLSERIGALRVGMDADIVVFDANPLEVFTKTLFTIIDGEIVYRGE